MSGFASGLMTDFAVAHVPEVKSRTKEMSVRAEPKPLALVEMVKWIGVAGTTPSAVPDGDVSTLF